MQKTIDTVHELMEQAMQRNRAYQEGLHLAPKSTPAEMKALSENILRGGMSFLSAVRATRIQYNPSPDIAGEAPSDPIEAELAGYSISPDANLVLHLVDKSTVRLNDVQQFTAP